MSEGSRSDEAKAKGSSDPAAEDADADDARAGDADADDADASGTTGGPPPTSAREALTIAAGVTLATTLALSFAFDHERAGTPAMLVAIGLCYAVLTTYALTRLRRRDELRRLFRPAGGDLSLGAVTAGLLYGAAHQIEHTLATPGSPREAWVMRLYLQLGDPHAVGRVLVGGAVFVVAALEEIVWRGLVMQALEAAFGPGRALAVTSVLFAVAHLPTIYLLRDPSAGYNPLIVVAALGCSVIWGAVYLRAKRLVPAIFAHALFSWAIVEFPIWRP